MNKNKYVFFLVKNRALGDSVLGLSSVSYLKSIYPNSIIMYAVPQWTAKLYQDINTDADFIYPLKMNSLMDILDLYTDLINLEVDCIHEMHQTGKGSKVFRIFSLIKNIAYTYHNHHLTRKTKVVDQGLKKELIQRDLDGVYSFFGKNLNRPNFLDFPPVFKLKTSSVKKNRIILGVVATRETKKWSYANYIELAEKVLNKQSDFEIIIPLSNSSEDNLIQLILEKLIQKTQIKIIKLPLDELPKYFAESLIYIGNDTGLKHIACAAGIKTITLFGPEPVLEWHPYDKNIHKALFIEDLACRTRIHHYCGLAVCDLPKNEFMQCMNKLTVEDVYNLVENI